MLGISQKSLQERAKTFDKSSFSVIKKVKGPTQVDADGPGEQVKKEVEFSVYDFKYYENELDAFEWWYQGELNLGSLKLERKFIDT